MSPVRLCFISAILTPHQAKLCAALNDDGHMDAHFWFYDSPDKVRGKYWNVEQTDKCHVLTDTKLVLGRFINYRIWKRLTKLDPDVLMLGGFSIPGNFLAYLWARKHKKKIVIFTERSRNKKGVLRRRGIVWRLLKWAYSGIDLVMVNAEDTKPQFRDTFKFGSKVVVGRYAVDLDGLFDHPLRSMKTPVKIIYANRMTHIYDPLMALDIFKEFTRRYGAARLLMNGRGEMRPECELKIAELEMQEQVQFMDDINTWDEIGEAYSRCDLLILPARFSNGNFTVFEAQASGIGVVISDKVLGVGNTVIDGKSGFVCSRNVSDFVDCLDKYVSSPELYKQIAHDARSLVKPLGVKGTAAFMSKLFRDNLGMSKD